MSKFINNVRDLFNYFNDLRKKNALIFYAFTLPIIIGLGVALGSF